MARKSSKAAPRRAGEPARKTVGQKSDRSAPRTRRGRGPGRPRADDGEATAHRDRIVKCAAELFAQQGFARTTTAQIARAAGTSDGTIFHHFATKRAILTEVGRQEGERVLALALAGVDPARPPPDPDPLLRPLFEYARREPDAYRLFAMDGDLEDIEAGFSAKRDLIVGGLSALLAGWSARGHLRRMDPDVVAALIFAIVDGAVRRLVIGDQWDAKDVWIDEACRAVRALVGPPLQDEPVVPPRRSSR